MKFLICDHCKRIVMALDDKSCAVCCCGDDMREIIAGTTEAAVEKHIPVYEVEGRTVRVDVGSVAHPMTEAHLIDWVALQTKEGCQIKYLTHEHAPKVEFALSAEDEVVAVYAYCNLHGLWKAE